MKKALALVIGNSNYTNEDDFLANSVNDAEEIAKTFQGVGIDVILKTDCKRVEFEKAIKKFASELESYPTAIFYYAGHAFQIERENYLSRQSVLLRSGRAATFHLFRVDGYKFFVLFNPFS